MCKLSMFHHLLHYVLDRAVDIYDFMALFGIWHHLHLPVEVRRS
jgi:hypothetical protein